MVEVGALLSTICNVIIVFFSNIKTFENWIDRALIISNLRKLILYWDKCNKPTNKLMTTVTGTSCSSSDMIIQSEACLCSFSSFLVSTTPLSCRLLSRWLTVGLAELSAEIIKCWATAHHTCSDVPFNGKKIFIEFGVFDIAMCTYATAPVQDVQCQESN